MNHAPPQAAQVSPRGVITSQAGLVYTVASLTGLNFAMALSAIMTTRVVTVHLDDSLQTIRELFEETGFHHLLVVDHQRVMGVISDRDLLKAVSPFLNTISERVRDRATLERKAHQIMTRDILTLQPKDTIVSAVALFNRHAISCIPIVDENMHLAGIVSWRDIMRYVETLVDKKKQA